jgi:hypothetical protein
MFGSIFVKEDVSIKLKQPNLVLQSSDDSPIRHLNISAQYDQFYEKTYHIRP